MSDSVHPSIDLLVRVFGRLPRSCLARLQEIFFYRHYRGGEAIFMQGEPAQAIYLIDDGRIKIERVSPDGHPCILCMRNAKETFCPVPLLDNGVQLGTAWAITDVDLLWADVNKFNAIALDCPALHSVVQQGCLLEVRRVLGRMELFAFRSVRDRITTIILDERHSYRGDPANEIRMTQQELAGLVGASRESVSRALARMEEEGLVKTKRGRIIILDEERLEALRRRHIDEG